MVKLNKASKLGLLIILGLGVAFVTCKKKQQEGVESTQKESTGKNEILIGEVVSLTGSEATFGISTRNAIEMAIKEVNQEGGIQGNPVRAIVLDDQSKPEEAATAITRLITQDKVIAVLGEIASSRTLAMAPIAQQNKIPMITPSSTNPKVTQIGDYIFRVCFIDPFQGPVMARFAFETLKSRNAAILKDVRNDYSMGLSKFFKEKYEELGGKILVEQSYSAGDIDFKAQLTAIRAVKPDFVYLPGYYTDVGLIIRQARELNINVPFGGGDGWDSDKLYEIGGKALDGTYYSNHYSPDAKDPILQKFVSEYRTKHASTPDGLAALGYDAAKVQFQAMKKAKSLSGPDLRDAIAVTKDFHGVTGNISINEKRDAVKSAVVLKVQDLKQHYMQTITPD